jgi:hypothetical protein
MLHIKADKVGFTVAFLDANDKFLSFKYDVWSDILLDFDFSQFDTIKVYA